MGPLNMLSSKTSDRYWVKWYKTPNCGPSFKFSFKLLVIILYTSTASLSDITDGNNGVSFSIEIFAAFLAVVPEAPVVVTVTAKAIFG